MVCLAACATTSPPTASGAAAPNPAVESRLEMEKTAGPTSEEVVLAKLEDAVRTVPPGKSAARIALGDVGHPRSEAEARAMGGMTLLLVTAVTRDPAELPVARAFARGGNEQADLPLIAFRQTSISDAASNVAQAFGSHRFDGLYLIPDALTRVRTTVAIDLKANRTNLIILELPLQGQAQAPGGVEVPTGRPERGAVERFCVEEFPLFRQGEWRRSPWFGGK